MTPLVNLMQRLNSSTVVWSWIFNGIRLASGIILLPLVLRLLTKADLGMYYLLIGLAGIVPIIDFGISVAVGRFVTYAMGGVEEVDATGVKKATIAGPNYSLVWRLLFTTQRLYRWLSAIAFVVIGIYGVVTLWTPVTQTTNPTLTWVAIGVTVISAALELYFGWWGMFLQNMNDVLYSVRIAAVGNILKLVFAAALLLSGLGLLALPVATLISSTLIREAARRRSLKLLGQPPSSPDADVTDLLKKLWPNSWRLGLQILSNYLRIYAPLNICTNLYGLEANQELGVSLQIFQILQSVSSVWTSVKWPQIGQHLVQENYPAIRKTLWPRFWLQSLTFCLAAAFLIPMAPTCISLISDKQMLPTAFLVILAINGILEMQFTFWTTLLSMENRLPYLWPSVISNLGAVVASVVLVEVTSMGMLALVLPPMVLGCLLNYWYWGIVGASMIKTTWWQFTFRPQSSGYFAK